MKPFLALITPLTDAGPDNSLPVPPPGFWGGAPQPGVGHPIAPGGPPPGTWGGVAPPTATNPIAPGGAPDQSLPPEPAPTPQKK